MKFALISWYGSGTNLFRSILNTHSDIYLHKELFILAAGFDTKKATPDDYRRVLDDAFACDKPIVGIDLKYDQISPEIEKYLIDNKVIIIHLLRDPMRTVWWNMPEHGTVSKSRLVAHCDKIASYAQYVRNVFADNRILEMTYEEMTGGRQVKSFSGQFLLALEWFLGVRMTGKLSFDESQSVKPLVIANRNGSW